MLERDRATLVRALRLVTPDDQQRGQPRYRMRTITDALAAQEVRNNVSTRGGGDRLRSRLGEIADELEQTHKELDAKRELIKVQPTLDAKQPYSRAAMMVFERLRDLHALARGAADRKPLTPRGVDSKPACKAPRTAPAGPYAMGSNS